jgi:hypothetical protein
MTTVQLLRELEKEIKPETADHLLSFIIESNEAKYLTQKDKLDLSTENINHYKDLNGSIWKGVAITCSVLTIVIGFCTFLVLHPDLFK